MIMVMVFYQEDTKHTIHHFTVKYLFTDNKRNWDSLQRYKGIILYASFISAHVISEFIF